MKMHWTTWLVTPLALAAALGACAADRMPQPLATPAQAQVPGGTGQQAAQLLQAMQAEIGDAACDTDTQCRTVGIGAQACGGPEAYLAWSAKVSDAARLGGLASRHRSLRSRDAQAGGAVSTCMVTPDPGATCRPRARDGKRVCEAGAAGVGGAGRPGGTPLQER